MERILVALESKANSTLITDLLKNNYNIQAYKEGAVINESFDLIIIDGKTLSSMKPRLADIKNKSKPVFQPVLFVSSKKGVGLITSRVWQLIDELVTTPISRMELFASVEILMRARRQSILLNERNIALAADNGALKRESAMMTDYFANVSHELRTPLAVILSGIDLLSMNLADKTAEPDNFKRTLEISKRNCHRLMRIINNLLDITKISSGHMELKPRNIDLKEKLSEVIESVKDYAANKDITLNFLSDTRCHETALDEDMFDRIMLNLLSNAIKYTPSQGVISVILQDGHSPGKIVISVKDNGIGIPADKLHTIFERFAQVDDTMTRRFEGCGLGLSLVKSLVELHGGRIWVESKPGIGSRFSVEFPVIRASAAAPRSIKPDIKDRIYYEFSDMQ